MPTSIANLWTPQIWVEAMQEKMATYPSVFNSGVVTKSELLDSIASGGGITANIPFFQDITDQADAIQVENTAPASDQTQPGGTQVATILNRETKNSVEALAVAVSGADPVGNVVAQLAKRRLKQRQATLIAILRGLLGGGATALNGAAPLSANRYGGTTAEIFSETGASPPAGQCISPTVFINTCALLGENADELRNGVFICHPNILAALKVLDVNGFKTTVMPSQVPFTIETYRQVPIVTSSSLVRAGTTSGFVYDSFLVAAGVVGIGEKPQVGGELNNPIADVASLNYTVDADKNNEIIYDRSRFLMHINGTKWVGTPAGQSATNAELQTVGNWNLIFQTAARVPISLMRTNG